MHGARMRHAFATRGETSLHATPIRHAAAGRVRRRVISASAAFRSTFTARSMSILRYQYHHHHARAAQCPEGVWPRRQVSFVTSPGTGRWCRHSPPPAADELMAYLDGCTHARTHACMQQALSRRTGRRRSPTNIDRPVARSTILISLYSLPAPFRSVPLQQQQQQAASLLAS